MLGNFHDFWPVQVYWDAYSCRSVLYYSRKKSPTTARRCDRPTHFSGGLSPTRELRRLRATSVGARTTKYIGQPPPGYRKVGGEPSSSHRAFRDVQNFFPGRSPSVQILEPIASGPSSSSPIDLRTLSPCAQRSVPLSAPPAFGPDPILTPNSACSAASFSPSRISIRCSSSPAHTPPFSDSATSQGYNIPKSITPTAQRIWPEACLSCGALPKLERADTSELPLFLNLDQNDDLLNILSTNGIFTNHHLHLVMQMTAEQRTDFFNTTFISAFRSLGLREDIEKYAERLGFGRKECKFSFPLPGQIVPRPNEDVLEELSKPVTKHEKFGEAMNTSMDLYWDVTNVLLWNFKSIIEPFPQTMFLDEIKTQYPHKWDEFQRVVCNERPLLLNYEDYWPIEVYIRRHLAQTPTPQQVYYFPRLFYPCVWTHRRTGTTVLVAIPIPDEDGQGFPMPGAHGTCSG
ncbi:hypothetical protein DFS33DRAFT_334876 [Desarmillaria ectypa]|nr:hypothetical protein DFS33DRAFT_334876 [Desarmillaria ectypa]